MREHVLYARRARSRRQGADLDATLAGFAGDLGLDTAAFGECMRTKRHLQFVQDDYRAAQAARRAEPPGVRDRQRARLTGALPFQTSQTRIDTALPK